MLQTASQTVTGGPDGRGWQPLVQITSLFLTWGFVSSVIDGLAPAARAIFQLSYTEQMLTQFAFFLAYGTVSLPASVVLGRLGAPKAIALALGTMVAGCLIVPFGTHLDSYTLILVALFVIASGITLLQVAANPLTAALGEPRGAPFRLTLAQAFNSLGTVLGPLVAARLLLSGGLFVPGPRPDQPGPGPGPGPDLGPDLGLGPGPGPGPSPGAPLPGTAAWVHARTLSLQDIDHQFALIGVLVALLGLALWLRRDRLQVADPARQVIGGSLFAAFRSSWGLFGALAIFLYVGSEVGVSTFMVNFLSQKAILGVSPARAAALLGTFFWGGAMVGRFLGSQALRFIKADHVLCVFATIGILLCLTVSQTVGTLAGAAALALGFFNSVMFPAIFSLTLMRSKAPPCSVSGLLCSAIVGGAVVPPLMGLISDRSGISAAFAVPLVGYVGVAVFALFEPAPAASCVWRKAPAPSVGEHANLPAPTDGR